MPVVLPKSKILKLSLSINLTGIEAYHHFWTKGYDIWTYLSASIINQPYIEAPYGKYNISRGDRTVYRHNHDVSHSIRQLVYAEKFIEKLGGTNNVVVLNLTDEELAGLKLALFLCRSGRTNELGGKDDPSNAARSANVFKIVAKAVGLNQTIIEELAFCISQHKPKLEDNTRKDLFKKVIDLSHHLDLVRCKQDYFGDEIEKNVGEEINTLFQFADIKKANEVAAAFLWFAQRCCIVTGTRIKYSRMGFEGLKNNFDKKYFCITATAKSIDQCRAVPFYSLPVDFVETDFVDVNAAASGIEKDLIQIINEYLNQITIDYKNQLITSAIKKINSFFSHPTEKRRDNPKVVACFALKKQLSAIIKNINLFNPDKEISTHQSKKTAILEAINYIKRNVDNIDGRFKRMIVALEKTICGVWDLKHQDWLRLATPSEANKLNGEVVRKASDQEKKTMRFEPARINRASNLFKGILREMATKPCHFGGDHEAIRIDDIYQVQNERQIFRFHDELNAKTRSQGFSSSTNEAHQRQQANVARYYHATDPGNVKAIIENGFDSRFCRENTGSGYGPLGKGIYLTDEVSKAATFNVCAKCASHRCCCLNEAGKPVERVLLITDVILGEAEKIIKKTEGLKYKATMSECDARISIPKKDNPNSEFNSKEVCVLNGQQIMVTHIVFYHFYTNILYQNPAENNELNRLRNSFVSGAYGFVNKIVEYQKSNDAKVAQLTALKSTCEAIINTIVASVKVINGKADLVNTLETLRIQIGDEIESCQPAEANDEDSVPCSSNSAPRL